MDRELQGAHDSFKQGVRGNEGTAKGTVVDNADFAFNPAVSVRQRRFMGAALGRRERGLPPRAGDPKMPLETLKDFARKP